tara:strand:- start:3070 stop:3666 length:597 start_codon:yes stop_codon:yes gene_type:complete
MPNWCNNNISIVGPKAKVDKLIDGARKGEFVNTLYPMPKKLQDTESSSDSEKMAKQPTVDGHNNWYDWRVDNWGTKWDVDLYEGSITEQEELFGKDDGDKKVDFGFDSAWAPPLGAIEHYLTNNDDVSIRLVYYEPGCDFMGVWEDFDDRCYNCSEDGPTSDSNFWETEDGKLIDDYMGCVERLAEYEAEQKEEANAK